MSVSIIPSFGCWLSTAKSRPSCDCKSGKCSGANIRVGVWNWRSRHGHRIASLPGKAERTLGVLSMGERWVNTGYCFTREDGEPMHPDSITSWLSNFSKKHGLPHINPHKFRHTQASILINEGVDIVTVAKRLGHKQVTTTENIYAHALAKADAEANAVVASVLFKKKA